MSKEKTVETKGTDFTQHTHYQEYYQVGGNKIPGGEKESGKIQLATPNVFLLAAKYGKEDETVKLYSQKGKMIGGNNYNANATEIVLLNPEYCDLRKDSETGKTGLEVTISEAVKNNKGRTIQFFVPDGGHFVFGRLEPTNKGKYNLVIIDPAAENDESEYQPRIFMAVSAALNKNNYEINGLTELSNNYQILTDLEHDDDGIWTCGYHSVELFKASLKFGDKLANVVNPLDVKLPCLTDSGVDSEKLVSSYQRKLNQCAKEEMILDLYKDDDLIDITNLKIPSKELKNAIIKAEKEEVKKKQQKKIRQTGEPEDPPVEPYYEESEELKKLKRQRDAQQEKFDNAETRKQTLETEPSTNYGKYAIYGIITLIALIAFGPAGLAVLAGIMLLEGGKGYYDHSQKKEANLAFTKENNKLKKLDDSIEAQQQKERKEALEKQQDRGDDDNYSNFSHGLNNKTNKQTNRERW